MYISKNLNYLRLKQGLTFAELSKQSGVNHSKIHRIESEVTSDPQIKDLIKLADFFEVTLDELVKVDLENGGRTCQ